MKKKTKITQTGETNPQLIETITTGETIEVVKEPTIFDTYRKYINMANSNYIHDLQYGDAMKILRYIEREIGHNISFSMSCPSCIIDLVKMFSRLENNK